MSGLVKFAGGVTALPENADAFIGINLCPSEGDSVVVSICPDASLADNPSTPNYTILGGNKSANAADMFPVPDEAGSSGSKSLTQPFVKNFWGYKYIGIQFSSNGDAGAGTVAFYMEERVTRVNLI